MLNNSLQFGVDISHHNGVINWDKLISRGVKFVYIRIGYGLKKDTRFDENFKNAGMENIKRGVYHYFLPSLSVTDQIDSIQEWLSPYDSFGELPIAGDFEYNRNIDGAVNRPNPAIYPSQVFKYLNLVIEKFGDVRLYTNLNICKHLLIHPDFALYSLWLAQWNAPCPAPPIPYFPIPDIWQYGQGNGAWYGVSNAKVDLNIMYKGILDE